MASGKDHDKYGLLAVLIATPLSIITYPDISIQFISGSLIGLIWLSPDLDLPQSRPTQRWGLFKFATNFYRIFHRKHRGLSHFPIIGSTVRFLFMFCFLFSIEFCIANITNEMQIVYEYPLTNYIKNNAIPLFVGVEYSSLVHTFLDAISTQSKIARRKLGWR